MINDRRQLADVFQQTINIVQKGHYTSENGEEVTLLDNEPMLKGSRFYTKPLDASNVPTLSEKNAKEKESQKQKEIILLMQKEIILLMQKEMSL